MPHNHEWQTRIKSVEKDHSAMRLAADHLLARVLTDPTLLQGDLRRRDIVRASEGLDGTYLIRLFAEFETGLRQYWATARGTHPPTRDLLNGLAALCSIPDDQQDNAHLVRDYRNSLVHEREEEMDPIPIDVARGFLCHFFSFLPPRW
jgi:hypothetical protein